MATLAAAALAFSSPSPGLAQGAPASPSGGAGTATGGTPTPAVVGLLLPPGRKLEGRAEVEALLVDPEIRELVFLVDGEEAARRSKPPWKVKLRFAEPARRQLVEVRALGARERLLGQDRREVNRFSRRFRVRLERPEAVEAGLRARGRIVLPPGEALHHVELAVGLGEPVTLTEDELEPTDDGVAFDRVLALPAGAVMEATARQASAFVRATAVLDDGRAVDNVAFVGQDVASVDVNLVQLQVLVTERGGRPLLDLGPDDFRLREGRKERQIERLELAGDVPLVLGLVIDSSSSMEAVWGSVRSAANAFVDHALGPRDRAFLVGFDTHVRLLRPLSDPGRAAVSSLRAGFDEIRPYGQTALYDSIAFSMLQFRDEPGRRALVVITDGADFGSHSDPKRSAELGSKLGIPVYFVSLRQPSRGLGRSGGQVAIRQGAATADLHLLAEASGGRVLRVAGQRGSQGGRSQAGGGLERAFAQIAAELRGQYVLGFYTPTDLDEIDLDALDLKLLDHPGAELRAVLPFDRVR